VSICVVALCHSTSLMIDVNTSHLLPFVFFSTLFAYNFQRLIRFRPAKLQSYHLSWINNHRIFLTFTLVSSLLLSFYFSFSLKLSAMYLLIPATVVSVCYPLKIFTFRNKKIALREFPKMKIFLIALVWTIVSVGLVVVENDSLFSLDTLLLFLARFSFVVAITIPFDIRDLKYDATALKTIPQLFGVRNAKKVALCFLAVFELISIIHFFIGGFSLAVLVALLMCSVFTALLIVKTKQEMNTFYFSFWVEGTSILMLILLFVIPFAFGIFVP